MKRRQEPAVIATICPVFGRIERLARSYTIAESAPAGDRPGGVVVDFIPPRALVEDRVSVVDGDGRFLLIEQNGRTVYDSRSHNGAARSESR